MDAEWIGVEEVAAEMKYTARQAWEYVRSIGLACVNARRMDLARFTRGEFEEARERAKQPIPPRVRSPLVPRAGTPAVANRPGPSPAGLASEKLARLRRA